MEEETMTPLFKEQDQKRSRKDFLICYVTINRHVHYTKATIIYCFSTRTRQSLYSAVDNMLDFDIIVSEFKLPSCSAQLVGTVEYANSISEEG